MTLDEVILDFEEAANDKCNVCGAEHKQLAEWLKELKFRRDSEKRAIAAWNRRADDGTKTAYPQDREENEYRYISPTWLNEIAKGLTKGAEKHPGETWRTIPTKEHLARAMRHINLYLMGDRGEPHLVNASMLLMMAFDTSSEAGE